MKKELKKIRKIKKDYPQLKQRNVITAHRHLDVFDYLRTTLEMDSYEFIKPILELLHIITELSLIVFSSLKKLEEALATPLINEQ